MKFINMRPMPVRHMPAIIGHFGPNLSESQPVRANITLFCTAPIPEATDVAARLKLRSEAMDLKNTEDPCEVNPDPKPVRMPVTTLIHQPKNIRGDLILLIKEPLS